MYSKQNPVTFSMIIFVSGDFFDNFNQQLILPLEYGELLVRSYASVTIDTPQSVHRN